MLHVLNHRRCVVQCSRTISNITCCRCELNQGVHPVTNLPSLNLSVTRADLTQGVHPVTYLPYRECCTCRINSRRASRDKPTFLELECCTCRSESTGGEQRTSNDEETGRALLAVTLVSVLTRLPKAVHDLMADILFKESVTGKTQVGSFSGNMTHGKSR